MLASITGKVIALGLALGLIARLRTRALYTLLESRDSWYDELFLNKEARDEVTFWLDNIQLYNGQPINFGAHPQH